jgi:hypothetical protein
MDYVDPSQHIRDLTRATIDIARERAELERALTLARVRLDDARLEIPVAERTAKMRRQGQLDAVRGRADLERRLHTLLESEALARTRRQQAEQRAQGFRAAATFAASGRAEVDGTDPAADPERNERERLVEARATREAGAAEARAAEERADEQKIGKLRAELEMHVAAEREVGLGFAAERDEAERRTLELREIVDRTTIEIGTLELAIERLAEEAALIAERRAALSEAFDDERQASLEIMEARVRELREIESGAAAERVALEAMIAALVASEDAQRAALLALEHDAIAKADAEAVAVAVAEFAEHAAAAATLEAAASTPSSEPEKPKAPLYVARPAAAKLPEKVKTESFIRPDRTPPPVVKRAGDEELIPGLKSLVGNIFTRAKKPEPIPDVVEPPESSSIAERIARDFGLLGVDHPQP